MRGLRRGAHGEARARVDAYAQHLADEDEYEFRQQAKRQRVAAGFASAIANVTASIVSFAGKPVSSHQGRMPGAKTVKRQRLDVDKLFSTMNDRHFRRRYRMDKESFWHSLILSRSISQAQARADQLADEFKCKSSVGICHCVGAIDGILIWIHKPTASDCEALGFGPIKFFCGRAGRRSMASICKQFATLSNSGNDISAADM